MKYVIIYNRNNYLYQIRCSIKILTRTNDIQYFTVKPILNVQYISNSNIIKKNQLCFSQIHEMGITFVSGIGYTTYDYYIKQRLPMCKIKLNQL